MGAAATGTREKLARKPTSLKHSKQVAIEVLYGRNGQPYR